MKFLAVFVLLASVPLADPERINQEGRILGALPTNSWSGVVTTSSQNASIPITNQTKFFRIRSQ